MTKAEWQYGTFYAFSRGAAPVSKQLAKFLNRQNITELHIVVQKADHVEIIYREEAR